MARANSTAARSALSRDELSAIHAAACELNAAFSALADLADGPDGRTAIPPGLIATIARRSRSLSGGIISIVSDPGSVESRDGQRRVYG